MLKTRVVGVLVVREGIVVQSIAFNRYLPVGVPDIAVEYFNQWGIDEIALLDIEATVKGRRPDHDRIRRISRFCHVPLLVGGGIGSVADIERLIRSGADKIALNTAAVEKPSLIADGARLFGSQCIVVSIDARRMGAGRYEAFIRSGKKATGMCPGEIAKRAEEGGAGEILINSIDRDGAKSGYDLELIRQVTEAVNIPVIVCGGVGHPGHFLQVMDLGISAVAAANFFHYTEHSVIVDKSFLKRATDNIRLDTYANYEGFEFDEDGRAAKKGDLLLEGLRFEFIPEEVI